MAYTHLSSSSNPALLCLKVAREHFACASDGTGDIGVDDGEEDAFKLAMDTLDLIDRGRSEEELQDQDDNNGGDDGDHTAKVKQQEKRLNKTEKMKKWVGVSRETLDEERRLVQGARILDWLGTRRRPSEIRAGLVVVDELVRRPTLTLIV